MCLAHALPPAPPIAVSKRQRGAPALIRVMHRYFRNEHNRVIVFVGKCVQMDIIIKATAQPNSICRPIRALLGHFFDQMIVQAVSALLFRGTRLFNFVATIVSA